MTRTGRGLLEPESVHYRHLSVIVEEDGEALAAPALAGEDLAERYRWYLEVGRGALVESLELLGDPRRTPLVFHCAAGKDRTGVLAALVLDILGVDRSVIVADYEITADRMELILGRYRSDPKFAARMAELPPSRFGVEAVTMERFLDRLYADFGGAREWALEAGVTSVSIADMQDHLLEAAG